MLSFWRMLNKVVSICSLLKIGGGDEERWQISH